MDVRRRVAPGIQPVAAAARLKKFLRRMGCFYI
jgi:hypothetical protein